jgi:Spy/CpxP family protein refolding chaperone
MKRITIVSIVAAVLILTGLVIVQAESRGQNGWWGSRWHRLGPANYLAHELKLSDAQRAQVWKLWQAERPIAAGHLRELLADNKELNTIARKDRPDQNAIQTVADREATTIATLLVEKSRLQSEIYSTVLNPDQRAKAIELENRLESRMERAAHHLDAQPAKQ